MSITIAAALWLTAAAPAAADEAQIKHFMAEVYSLYMQEGPEANRHWKEWETRDLYSREVAQMFRRWRSLPKEADDINDVDGLCDCQGQNGPYGYTITALTLTEPGQATVQIVTRNGTVGPAHLTFRLVKEAGRWRIDDIHWLGRHLWMKAALRQTIEAESKAD